MYYTEDQLLALPDQTIVHWRGGRNRPRDGAEWVTNVEHVAVKWRKNTWKTTSGGSWNATAQIFSKELADCDIEILLMGGS